MKSLLFYSKAPMNYVMFRSVAERLMRDPELKFLLHADVDPGQRAEDIYPPLGIARDRLVGSMGAKLRAFDLYVSADYKVSAPRAKRKVHVFHGISFKGKAYIDHILKFDRAFLIGPYQRAQFVKRGILAPDDPRMVDIGMPKTDALLDGSLKRETILRELGVDPAKPVVLYAPTWRRESSLNTMGEEIMRAIGAMSEVTLLVKIHDLCLNPATNSRDWGAWLAAQETARAPWKWVRDWDATPLLAAADVLVSDASSVANEFLLLDRPIIFMDVPALLAKYADFIDLDTWGRKTGTIVADPATLPASIAEALANPRANSETRRAAAADYFYNPGHATDASVRAIRVELGFRV